MGLLKKYFKTIWKFKLGITEWLYFQIYLSKTDKGQASNEIRKFIKNFLDFWAISFRFELQIVRGILNYNWKESKVKWQRVNFSNLHLQKILYVLPNCYRVEWVKNEKNKNQYELFVKFPPHFYKSNDNIAIRIQLFSKNLYNL